jgi:hypothetical protein
MNNISRGQWLRERTEQCGFSARGLCRIHAISRSTLTRIFNGGTLTRRTIDALRVPLRLTGAEVEALARGELPKSP